MVLNQLVNSISWRIYLTYHLNLLEDQMFSQQACMAKSMNVQICKIKTFTPELVLEIQNKFSFFFRVLFSRLKLTQKADCDLLQGLEVKTFKPCKNKTIIHSQHSRTNIKPKSEPYPLSQIHIHLEKSDSQICSTRQKFKLETM